ncbi:RNA-binding protein [Entamoeba marina]
MQNQNNKDKKPRKTHRRSHKKKVPNQPKKRENIMTGIKVSNIPITLTIDDFIDYFKKCGMLKKKSPTEPIAYFENETQETKQGVLFFLYEESVFLALDLYDKTQIKPGFSVTIEAVNSNDVTLPTTYDQSRELDWDDNKLIHVVIKNMFNLNEVTPTFIKELKEDIRDEVSERCGDVETITIFETNPEGVVVIKFKTHEGAERCVNLMNNRWFSKRQLTSQAMGSYTLYNTHPRNYGKGSRRCRRCNAQKGLIRKYGLDLCRRCFREKANEIGFFKLD